MRFPRRWHGRDAEKERAEEEYQARIRSWSEMPLALWTMVRGVSIHDGLIRRFVVDRARKTVQLRIRCGWVSVGYYDLDLRFRGVWFPGTTVAKVERLAARWPNVPDALYDGIDRDEAGRCGYRGPGARDDSAPRPLQPR